jgi:hypothetical protein
MSSLCIVGQSHVTHLRGNPSQVTKSLWVTQHRFRKMLLFDGMAHVTQDIFAHNISIKRYNFEPLISMSNQGKLLTKHKVPYLWFVKSLPWPIEIDGSKLSFYCNIFFLWQDCVQKYLA